MNESEHRTPRFSTAARRVVLRLFVVQWIQSLNRSAAMVYAAAAVLAVYLWYDGSPRLLAAGAIALVPAWLTLSGNRVACRRKHQYHHHDEQPDGT